MFWPPLDRRRNVISFLCECDNRAIYEIRNKLLLKERLDPTTPGVFRFVRKWKSLFFRALPLSNWLLHTGLAGGETHCSMRSVQEVRLRLIGQNAKHMALHWKNTKQNRVTF